MKKNLVSVILEVAFVFHNLLSACTRVVDKGAENRAVTAGSMNRRGEMPAGL